MLRNTFPLLKARSQPSPRRGAPHRHRKKRKIPLQHEAISRSTKTDADVIYTSRDDIPSALISIPLRYMHSPVKMISMEAVASAARLAAAVITGLSPKDTFHIHG